MKILIAEDDPVSVKIVQFTLQHWGHEVIVTTDGATAWETFDKDPVRVIVSDWMMPGLDGLELCQKVRTRPKTEYTYFILLTAINTGRDNLRKAMDAGIDDFLTKPVDREAVFMRLRVAERILGFTTEIKMLKELIPICMYCKRVRDDQDYWQQVETYIHKQTGSHFSHGICPECFEKQVAQLPGRAGLKVTPRG
jgi:DNA-binding response OmpR family regulator